MTKHADTLLAEALRLPEKERGDLAVKLIESLDPLTDEDVESAWSAEIQKRIEEVEQGRVKPIPWSEARQLILKGLDESNNT